MWGRPAARASTGQVEGHPAEKAHDRHSEGLPLGLSQNLGARVELLVMKSVWQVHIGQADDAQQHCETENEHVCVAGLKPGPLWPQET